MAQKLLTPFKKLPQQIQNLPIFKKLHDFTTKKQAGILNCSDAALYGVMENPVSLAYDEDLCLLAVGYAHGHIEVYGMPGFSFPVIGVVENLKFIEFIRNEGRLILANTSSLFVIELNVASGCWEKKHSVNLPFSPNEIITSIAVGNGVIFVGSSSGTLRQVAIEAGNMTVGDDDLTSLPCHLILNSMPEDKRELLKLNSAIVSIELHPGGEALLLGYAGGTAIIAQPQTAPSTLGEPAVVSGEKIEDTSVVISPESGQTTTEAALSEAVEGEPLEEEALSASQATTKVTTPKKSKTGDRHVATNLHAIQAQASKKFRTLSKTIRSKIEHTVDEKPDLPPLPVPPSPRVFRLLPYAQALCCATWRITSTTALDPKSDGLEVLISYDDGAHLTWTIPRWNTDETEPVIIANQEIASIPYGPLPCAPIQRIIARPSTSGGVITAFTGGLPRAQHAEKHTLSVFGGTEEEHVCLQFGSAVRDFLVLPSHPQPPACQQDIAEETETGCCQEVKEERCGAPLPAPLEAGYLLVLTERELVAVDLGQATWPTIPSPYLKFLDCSRITAMAHISVPSTLMARIQDGSSPSGFEQWPIVGGRRRESDTCGSIVQHPDFNDIVAIADTESDVTLWHLGRGGCFHCLGRIHSFAMLDVGEMACRSGKVEEEEEAWPPFRRVGDFAVSDAESRLAVHSLSLQLVDGELVVLVGGAVGNFAIWSTACGQKDFEPDVAQINVDLLESVADKFVWEGPSSFKPMEGLFQPCAATASPAFGLQEMVQFNPPSAVIAAAYEPGWQALAVGSVHGFAIIDLKSRAVVFSRLTHGLQVHTVKPSSTPLVSAVGDTASRITASGRQLKATLRESFRKMRKVRSQPPPLSTPSSEDKKAVPSSPAKGDEVEATACGVVDEALTVAAAASQEDVKPIDEKETSAPSEEEEGKTGAIEEAAAADVAVQVLRPTDACGVSALCLADTFVMSGLPASPRESRPAFLPPRTASLFAGSQRGVLLAYCLAWPHSSLEVHAVREVCLKHGAPVVNLSVIDAKVHCPLMESAKTRCAAEVIPEPPTSDHIDPECPKTEAEPNDAKPTGVEEKTKVPDDSEDTDAGGAASARGAPDECHELVVCTEEQVRLVGLPLFKTKQKYRFWETAAASGGGGGAGIFRHTGLLHRGKSETSSAAPVVTGGGGVAEVVENAAVVTEEAVDKLPEAPVAVPESDPKFDSPEAVENPGSASVCQRRVVDFGLQQLPGCDDWYAVVALKCGRLYVLSIPGLRRILKASCFEDLQCHYSKTISQPGCGHSCVSRCANLTFWRVGSGLLVANEVAFTPPCRLASPVFVNGLSGSRHCLCLPTWARPGPPSLTSTAAAAAGAAAVPLKTATTAVADEEGPVVEVTTGENGQESTTTDVKSMLSDLESTTNETTKEVNDFTNDITKNIAAEGGTVVAVRTAESCQEKHTVIEGGNVVTTVHETERIDGEVVRDDLVHVKSGVEAEGGDEESGATAEKIHLAATA